MTAAVDPLAANVPGPWPVDGAGTANGGVAPASGSARRGSGRPVSRVTLYLVLVALALWAVLMVSALFSLGSRWPDAPLGTDFLSFWTGASLVRQGAGPSLYDMDRQQGLQQELLRQVTTFDRGRMAGWLDPYHNPPPLALLFVPLTWGSVSLGYLLWWVLSLSAFLGGVALSLRGAPHARTMAALMLAFAPVADTLIWGQVDGLFLLALSAGLLALVRGRPFLAGALLGILWLKPQYAVLFPLVFLFKGRWRELAGMVATGCVVVGASIVVVGPEGILRYLDVLHRIGSFRPPSSSLILPQIMVNWRGLLTNLWPDIPDSLGSTLVVLLAVATALLALPVWRGEWAPSTPRFARQLLVTVIATVIAIPHSHFHGLVLLLPALALIAARPMVDAPISGWWQPMLATGYLLAVLLWPLEDQRWLMVPYLLLAMAILTAQCWVLSGRPSGVRTLDGRGLDPPASHGDPVLEEPYAAHAKP